MAESPRDCDGNVPTPRWVKVFGIIAIFVFIAFVILHLAGGGPGRHFGH